MAQQGDQPQHFATDAHFAGSPADSGFDAGSSHDGYDQDNHDQHMLEAYTESDDVSTDEGYVAISTL